LIYYFLPALSSGLSDFCHFFFSICTKELSRDCERNCKHSIWVLFSLAVQTGCRFSRVRSFGVFYEKAVVASMFVCLALLVITAGEGTNINVANKTYQEYTSFFFFLKVGPAIQYAFLDKIFINTSKISQRVYTAHTSISTVHSKRVYN